MQESPALLELSVLHSRWVFASCQWLRGGGCAEQTSHGLQCPAAEGAGVSASSRVFLGVFSPSESRGCFWSFVAVLPTAQLCADSLGSLLNWRPVLGAGWRGWIPAGWCCFLAAAGRMVAHSPLAPPEIAAFVPFLPQGDITTEGGRAGRTCCILKGQVSLPRHSGLDLLTVSTD